VPRIHPRDPGDPDHPLRILAVPPERRDVVPHISETVDVRGLDALASECLENALHAIDGGPLGCRRPQWRAMNTPATPTRRDWLTSAGLLVLRLSTAGMMIGAHGWPKLSTFSEKVDTWADPIGLGSATSLVLAVFAEFFCSILLALGLATRLAAVPLLCTMLVAALVVHADDPWGKKEFALLYAFPFITLILTGAGLISLDELIKRMYLKRRAAAATSSNAAARS
jgi:putative oxidoreductase